MFDWIFRRKKEKESISISDIHTQFITVDMLVETDCANIEIDIDICMDKEYLLILDDDYAQTMATARVVRDVVDESIICLYGKDAVLKLLCLLKARPNIKITKAIVDITFGKVIESKGIKYKANGIDALKALLDVNSNLDFILYTGNSLNKYLSYTKEILSKFRLLCNKSIFDYIVIKGSLPIDKKGELLIASMKGI